MRITSGELLYESIQQDGTTRINRIVDIILKDLNSKIGIVLFQKEMTPINKIYVLIEEGFYPYMKELLKQYGYDLAAELQYLIFNLGEGKISSIDTLAQFPSYKSIDTVNNQYIFSTALGKINITALHMYLNNKEISNFSMNYNNHGLCHVATLEFIKQNSSYKGITSLVINQFGEKQYHSYVEDKDSYVDFAKNVYLSKKDFNKFMKPEILSEVYGYELDERIAALNEEDLPVNKNALVRLAVHEQLRRSR